MIPGDSSELRASRRVRSRARRLCHRARHRLRVERDRLSAATREHLGNAERRLRWLNRGDAGATELGQGIAELETALVEAFPVNPHLPLRSTWEIFMVAAIIALAGRTFFIQPFSVPTGSMEPTLQGITTQDLRDEPGVSIPGWLGQIWAAWVRGTRYYEVTAKSEGELEEVIEPAWLHPFAQYRFRIGDTWYRVRTSLDHFLQRAGVETERVYRPGETVLRFSFTHGDYILVDRFTYNFRRPRRGEIVVFETRDIEELPPDQYYVKRLVALGSDRVRIGNDRHLVINDQRLDETTPGFEALYTSRDDRVPTAYAGHINATVAAWIGLRRPERLARLFPDEETVYEVRPKHALVMGDNALFSLDSRVWGDLPYRNLMGRAWYVYWPLSERVGRCGP